MKKREIDKGKLDSGGIPPSPILIQNVPPSDLSFFVTGGLETVRSRFHLTELDNPGPRVLSSILVRDGTIITCSSKKETKYRELAPNQTIIKEELTRGSLQTEQPPSWRFRIKKKFKKNYTLCGW